MCSFDFPRDYNVAKHHQGKAYCAQSCVGLLYAKNMITMSVQMLHEDYTALLLTLAFETAVLRWYGQCCPA